MTKRIECGLKHDKSPLLEGRIIFKGTHSHTVTANLHVWECATEQLGTRYVEEQKSVKLKLPTHLDGMRLISVG